MLTSEMSKILKPFGPPIYKDIISGEFHQFLLDAAEVARRNSVNVGSSLAGNIENQLELPVDPNGFISFIYPHIENYVRETGEGLMYTEPFTDISFNLDKGPWINFQHKNEFNPIHSHSGMFSAVIMVDIPEEIAVEKTPITNMPCHGMLEFVHGGADMNHSGFYKVTPRTADIYLFPASLRHTVYPFTSDVERVTVSLNVHNIEFFNKE